MERRASVPLNDVLTAALIVNVPLPNVTVTLAGPNPPVNVPLKPVGATIRLPLTVTGPEAPWTLIFATETSIAPVEEFRVKVRSPVRAGRLPTVTEMPVPATLTPVAESVTVTVPDKDKPVA